MRRSLFTLSFSLLLVAGVARNLEAQPGMRYDERPLKIRMFGSDGKPISRKRGYRITPDTARLLLNGREDPDSIYAVRVRVNDQSWLLSDLPATFTVTTDQGKMVVQTWVEIDSLTFHPGTYIIPKEYEHLFHAHPGGTPIIRPGPDARIINRELSWFAVPSLADTLRRSIALYGKSDTLRAEIPAPATVSTFFAKIDRKGERIPGSSVSVATGRVQYITPKWSGEYPIVAFISDTDSICRVSWISTDSTNFGHPGFFFNVAFRNPAQGLAFSINKGKPVVFRTDDSGKNWSVDTALSRLGILSATFPQEKEGYLLGVPPDENQSFYTVRLYATDDGKDVRLLAEGIFNKTLQYDDDAYMAALMAALRDVPLTLLNRDRIVFKLEGKWEGIRTNEAWRLKDSSVYLIDVEPVDEKTALMLENTSLMKTTDAGATWSEVLKIAVPGCSVIAYDRDRFALYSPMNFLLLTMDGGSRWIYLSTANADRVFFSARDTLTFQKGLARWRVPISEFEGILSRQ